MKIIVSLVLISASVTSHAVCRPGQITALMEEMSVIPCGRFDVEKKVCADTAETTLPVGTPVHITSIKDQKAEVYIDRISGPKGDRYINKLVTVDIGSESPKTLSCVE